MPTTELTFWTMVLGILVTVPCALLGCYLVLRRMSMLGDAISHSVLPGMILAALLSGTVSGWPIVAGAMCFGVLAAALTQMLHSKTGLPEDSSMGIVFTGLFALGVVLLSQKMGKAHFDTDCMLYGELGMRMLNKTAFLGLDVPPELPSMLLVLLLTVGFITLFWKELQITSFDPELARTLGLRTGAVHYLLMALVAAVAVTAFQAVGSVLVIAMLIVPAATAQMLTDRLLPMLLVAAAAAASATVLGIWLGGADMLNTNLAGMLAVAAGAQLALVVLLAPRYGVLSRMLRHLRLALRIRAEDILAVLYRRDEHRSDPQAQQHFAVELIRVRRGLLPWLALRKLHWQGLVRTEPDGALALTALGRQSAESVVRAHRLWESYLGEHFPLPLDHLHSAAERMEHYIGPDLQERLQQELPQASVDPHGRAIPPTS